MQFIFAILIFAALSIAALGQGTMSTDDSTASGSAASLSGYTTEDPIDLRDEEIEMQEDNYDPSVDDKPLEIKQVKEKTDQ
jgi:hypothetical protein